MRGPPSPSELPEVNAAGGERLGRQLGFLLEVDRAKTVLRRSYLADASRRENDAEHMWHVALAAFVLAEHGGPGADLAKVVAMLLVHDIVEIDAGDTFVYDTAERAKKVDAERRAASRLFGLLPVDQAVSFQNLFEELEEGASEEARLAKALDRLLPLLLGWASEGRTWAEHKVTAQEVRAVNAAVAEASPALGAAVEALIADAVGRGFLPEA